MDIKFTQKKHNIYFFKRTSARFLCGFVARFRELLERCRGSEAKALAALRAQLCALG